MKKLLFTLSLLICFQLLKAQTETISHLEEKAYYAYLNSNMALWKMLAPKADKILDFPSDNQEDLIKAIKLKYGLLYSCLASKEKDEATFNEYIGKTSDQMSNLLKLFPNSSELLSVSAAIMSVQMAFSPAKAVFLSAKSGKEISKALEIDSTCALAWRQDASSKYFTPKMWGGDIDEAVKEYEKAVRLFEAQNATKDWMYLDAMVWLGIAYSKLGQEAKAKEIFEKALLVEPDFWWVKKNLLPGLSKSSK
ncbi:MAG: tetratricopeptide repeat protein [Bacteroidales bacterium]|jgi:tetratricopeptide (TPR) repeat protein